MKMALRCGGLAGSFAHFSGMRVKCTDQWHSGKPCVCVCCMHVRRHAYLWGMHAETRDCCQEYSIGLHFHLFIWEQYLSVNPVLAAWLDRLASESIVSA